jgi:hypothetical protein
VIFIWTDVGFLVPVQVDPLTGELPPGEPASHTFFFVPYQHSVWLSLGFWLLAIAITSGGLS